ncbi:nuclear transport factor 2 family protein [Dyella acidisoli]|uniref:DUF4440 domain-containing protein n=1 Tax=Dyella acidisoli TaxID=1867834 RepID=A0ABQ5XUG9_9GAMM|nr:nuclear transport factor 2 family protein [Dyella acidisoli]GLQ94412.1 hypothetical protein GCM10007901_33640 [Dyella acidisoli]
MTNKRILHLRIVLATLLPWIAATALPTVCDAAASPTTAPTAINNTIGQRLIAEERASWDLAIKGNAASYTAFHAPDFFTVTGTGVVDRTHSETSAMDANVRFDQCELSGFDVRFVAENAALVTYHVRAAGLDHGKAFKLDSYASSLWMKRDGKWLNVFYQATPVLRQ